MLFLIGVSMHCVREEHSAVNMNLHYLENGTVMLNFIYRKELFFLPLGFVLKVRLTECICYEEIHWRSYPLQCIGSPYQCSCCTSYLLLHNRLLQNSVAWNICKHITVRVSVARNWAVLAWGLRRLQWDVRKALVLEEAWPELKDPFLRWFSHAWPVSVGCPQAVLVPLHVGPPTGRLKQLSSPRELARTTRWKPWCLLWPVLEAHGLLLWGDAGQLWSMWEETVHTRLWILRRWKPSCWLSTRQAVLYLGDFILIQQ